MAWHGDKALAPHLWAMLGARSLDVRIALGAPFVADADRKTLAARLENAVRTLAADLTGRPRV